MKMLFLVDGDNNIGTGLTGLNLLSETDTVLIFHSRGMQLAKLKARAEQSRAEVRFIESVKDGKNSVDFQIIAELGVRIGRGEVEFAYVISQDQGYVAPIESLKLHYPEFFREIRLARSIEDCLHLIFILRATNRSELSTALAAEYGTAHGNLIYRHLAGLFGAIPQGSEDTAAEIHGSDEAASSETSSLMETQQRQSRSGQRTSGGDRQRRRSTGNQAVPSAQPPMSDVFSSDSSEQPSAKEADPAPEASDNADKSAEDRTEISSARDAAFDSNADTLSDTAKNIAAVHSIGAEDHADRFVAVKQSAEMGTPGTNTPAAPTSFEITDKCEKTTAQPSDKKADAGGQPEIRTVIYPFKRASESRFSVKPNSVIVACAPVIPGAAESFSSAQKDTQTIPVGLEIPGTETKNDASEPLHESVPMEKSRRNEANPKIHSGNTVSDVIRQSAFSEKTELSAINPAHSEKTADDAVGSKESRPQKSKNAVRSSAAKQSRNSVRTLEPSKTSDAKSATSAENTAGLEKPSKQKSSAASEAKNTSGKRPAAGRQPKASTGSASEHKPESVEKAADASQTRILGSKNEKRSNASAEIAKPNGLTSGSAPQNGTGQNVSSGKTSSRKSPRQASSAKLPVSETRVNADAEAAADKPAVQPASRTKVNPEAGNPAVKNHNMKLYPEQFEKIKAGTKQIEIRCNDAKRQKIHPGDTITLVKQSEDGETMVVYVTGMFPAASFRELFEQFDPSAFGCAGQTIEEMLSGIYKIFDKRKEKKYGAVGIGVSLTPNGKAPSRLSEK